MTFSTARTAAAALATALLLFLCPSSWAAMPHEVAIARGIDLINHEQYREALGPLAEAVAAAPENPEALFYAGIAHSRLGEYAEAEGLFRRALAVAETSEIHFELGRVAALTGRCTDAESSFARAHSLGAVAAEQRSGDLLLEKCRAKGGKLPYHLALTFGWQHDSNVVLGADHPTSTRPTGKADDRALANFTAGATVLQTPTVELGLGYTFYGSLHADLTDYDALYHKVSLPLVFNPGGHLRPALGYTLEHTSFGGDKYGLVQTATASLGFQEGADAVTEAVAEHRWNRFWESELFTDNEGRTGTGWSAGLRQRVQRGPLDGRLFAFYDRDDADDKIWAFTGWRAGAGLRWHIAEPLALGAAAEYQSRDYRAAPAGEAEAREDRTWQWSASLVWAFSRRVSAALTASRTVNDSNLAPYAYHRTIYGVVLSAGL